MPGRFDRDRLLALALQPGALDGARGMIGATGEVQPKPDLNKLIAAHGDSRRVNARKLVRRAA